MTIEIKKTYDDLTLAGSIAPDDEVTFWDKSLARSVKMPYADFMTSGNLAPFASRADLVDWIAAGNTAPDGAMAFAGGLAWVAQTGATAIADMPGWVPEGSACPYHWGTAGDGVTNDTTAFAGFIAYVNANPGEYDLGLGNYLIAAGTIDVTAQGVILSGRGAGNVANLTPSQAAPTTITITGTGTAARSRNQGNIFRHLHLTSDATRAALSFDITQPGIRIEPDDTSTARADRNALLSVRVDKQPGDGVLLNGNTTLTLIEDTDVYECKGFGLRGDPGLTTGITRTNTYYIGLLTVGRLRVGYCGGHAVALSCPDADQQAEMAVRCTITQLDTFGNGSNTSIMYPSADSKSYGIWVFGENCAIEDSAPDGRQGTGLTNEVLGGVWIAGRDNRLINNRFIQTAQPVYWGHVSAQPSTGLTVDTMRIVNATLTHAAAVAVQSASSTGLRVRVDRVESFTDIATRRLASGAVDAHVSFGGKERHTNGLISSGDELIILDDHVAIITLRPADASNVVSAVLTIAGTNVSSGGGIFHCRVGSASPATTKWAGETNTVAGPSSGNGALNGTTGTDAFLTISCDATSIYIENRRGFSVTLNYTLSSVRRDAAIV